MRKTASMRETILNIKEKYVFRASRFLAVFLVLVCMATAFISPAAAYAAGTGDVTLTASQTFTNNGASAAPGNTFSYTLTAENASDPMPSGSASGSYTFNIAGTDTVNLGLKFTAMGTYRYEMKCVTAAAAGYTIDPQVYTIEVWVTNSLDTTVIVYLSDGNKANNIAFAQSYQGTSPPPTPPPNPPTPPTPPPPNPPTPPGTVTPQPPVQPIIDNPVPQGPGPGPGPVNPPEPPVIIPPVTPPQAAPSTDNWSLLSCMMSIMAILTALALLIFIYFRNRMYEKYEGELDDKGLLTDERQDELDKLRKKGHILKILAVIAGIITPIVWYILDWPLTNMVWINHSTPWTALVFIITMILTLAFNLRKKYPEDEGTEKNESGSNVGSTGAAPVYGK